VTRLRVMGWTVAAAAVAAASLTAVQAASGSPTYPLSAVFSGAPGLFPGASVEVLGVRVGTVTSVRNVGDAVVVGMRVDDARPIPVKATAALVAPELLGEPDIELDPGYTGGPALATGSTIPASRTSVPVSTDQLLKSLQKTLDAIDPHAVGDLIDNLAQDLDGQGQGLNRLIGSAAGTIELLADKEDDLGQLSGTLSELTGTLDSRTAEITQLITDYDTVSQVVAGHDAQLGDAITQLAGTSTQLVQLLTPNLGPLEQDVGTVTTVGRTLDRNLGSVDQTLTSATSLFAAAGRAYTATHDWLTLNLQTPLGITGAYLAGLVRDRLAGVCRRIAANHSQDLSAADLETLEECGNPSSGFFDPVIDQFPTILGDIQDGKAPSAPSPAAMLQQGLAEIPGASAALPAVPAPVTSNPPAAPGPPSAPATTTTTTTTPPPGPGAGPCLGGLLGSVVTCSSGSGSSAGGAGALLAYRVPLGTAATQPSATAPSLTAPSAELLPPLPASAPGARGAAAPAGRRARQGNVRHGRATPRAEGGTR
jgi:phospholipid/cholesterol/gamma-HCH transport system substrate-binding protein